MSPRRRGDRGEKAMVPEAEIRTYYDKPILKQPVWKWFIPAYFFTGGLAAGSAMLAAGARLRGDRRLARQSRTVALGALGVSTALLIKDLGRPGEPLASARHCSSRTWGVPSASPTCCGSSSPRAP